MAGKLTRYGLIAIVAWLCAPATWANMPIMPPPPSIAASSYLLVDADTLEVLVAHNIHEPLPPASLTKIMTAYVAEVELEAGRVQLEDQVPISVNAWQTPGSRMFIREGTRVSLEDLLRGVVIQSGNDASVAIAEYLAGSERAFADMMNQQAVQLGMQNSSFQNATGLSAEGHYTTAWDMALLTRAMIKNYPEHYAIYAERSFNYNNIDQPNRNRLLWRDRTVDGVKTGHTDAAGWCLVASAVRDNMRLISVVMGTDSDESRMRETQKLLSYGFRHFETQQVYHAGVSLKRQALWFGTENEIELGAAEDVYVTVPRGRYEQLEAELHIPRVIEAPVAQGQEFGELRLKLDGKTVLRAPLVALAAVDEAGFFSRLIDGIYLFFHNLLAND
ncbi:MAG: D-alanyl-D-alanine carboxypeptidase family protein [Pseudomonadales bacterium]